MKNSEESRGKSFLQEPFVKYPIMFVLSIGAIYASGYMLRAIGFFITEYNKLKQ